MQALAIDRSFDPGLLAGLALGRLGQGLVFLSVALGEGPSFAVFGLYDAELGFAVAPPVANRGRDIGFGDTLGDAIGVAHNTNVGGLNPSVRHIRDHGCQDRGDSGPGDYARCCIRLTDEKEHEDRNEQEQIERGCARDTHPAALVIDKLADPVVLASRRSRI